MAGWPATGGYRSARCGPLRARERIARQALHSALGSALRPSTSSSSLICPPAAGKKLPRSIVAYAGWERKTRVDCKGMRNGVQRPQRFQHRDAEAETQGERGTEIVQVFVCTWSQSGASVMEIQFRPYKRSTLIERIRSNSVSFNSRNALPRAGKSPPIRWNIPSLSPAAAGMADNFRELISRCFHFPKPLF